MKTLTSTRLQRFRLGVRLLAGLGIGVAIASCQQPTVSADAHVVATGPVAPTVGVPLPQQTPFDDDPSLRAVYIEWFTTGYNLAVSRAEYTSPGCLCEARGDPRRYSAMSDGFFAGREAGARVVRSSSPAE